MPELYWSVDGVLEHDTDATTESVAEMWGAIEPVGGVVALDTETSGLFVDGDWKDAPKARVSVVSLAWEESIPHGCAYGDCSGCEGGYTTQIVSVAIPFDQGFIGGKPGKWSDELDDYETLPHTDECVRTLEAWKAPWNDPKHSFRCVCAPWNVGLEAWQAMCKWLADKRLVMHNMKYDLHIVNAGLRDKPETGVNLVDRTVWDTMLAQGIIEPLHTSSLKPTSERLWGVSCRDEEAAVKEALRKLGTGLTWRYDLLAWDVLGPYATKDTELTLRLFNHQQTAIEEGIVIEPEITFIREERDLAATLFKMELRRVGYDIDQMVIEADKMEVEVAKLEAQLPFQPVNVNSAKRYFFGELGIAPIKVTDVCTECTYNRQKQKQRKGSKKPLCLNNQHTWSPSLDEEVASRLAHDGVPFAEEWVLLAKHKSALSKWYRAWPRKAVRVDGMWRLMTNFRQGRIESDHKGQTSGGAISGRLSAERIQLQGFPDDYRLPPGIVAPKKMILAKPGHEIHELDVSNAEVRVAAWLMRSPTLAAACASGNVHSANTLLMFGDYLRKTFPGGWDEAWAVDMLLMDVEGTPILDKEGKTQYKLTEHPEWGKYRKIAKTTILGMFFGAGIRTLRGQVEKETKENFAEAKVRKFVEDAMAVVPQLKPVSNRMQQKADKSLGGVGYIRLVNGRRRWFGWSERTHKAFNAGTQGGVAETMKILMRWVEDTYPGILINQVHDSMWLECPEADAARIVSEVKAYGERLFTRLFSTPEIPIQFEMDSKRLA